MGSASFLRHLAVCRVMAWLDFYSLYTHCLSYPSFLGANARLCHGLSLPWLGLLVTLKKKR